MYDTFFGGHAAWFTWPGIIGTAFFVLRMVLMIVGGVVDADLHTDVDVHADLDVSHGDVVTDASDSTHAFQFLSIQSILAFAIGFGWGGLALLKGSGLHNLAVVIALAVVCGAAMVWLLGLLLKGAADLQSSGNVSISAALGRDATVYASIPARGAGRGRVRVVIDDRQKIYAAVSESDEIPTSARVRVVGVNDDNTLTVAAV